LSLGGCRQKLIGALNSARIGAKVELKFFQNFCLERSGKVWKELKKIKMSINQVWVVVDKNQLVH
jgi:hypothetical protein